MEKMEKQYEEKIKRKVEIRGKKFHIPWEQKH